MASCGCGFARSDTRHGNRRCGRRNVNKGVAMFAMSKVVYVISTVKSTSRCSTVADSASRELSMSELDQLKQAAEKYDRFRKVYPLRQQSSVERLPLNRTGASSASSPSGEVPIRKLGGALQAGRHHQVRFRRRLHGASSPPLDTRRLGVLGTPLLHRSRESSPTMARASSAWSSRPPPR